MPRAMQRLRIPAPITSLLLGIGAMLAWGDRTHDPAVSRRSTLGMPSLSLLAGRRVDMSARRSGVGHLCAPLLIRVAMLGCGAWVACRHFGFGWQAATLLALALWTPSAGFILDIL